MTGTRLRQATPVQLNDSVAPSDSMKGLSAKLTSMRAALLLTRDNGTYVATVVGLDVARSCRHPQLVDAIHGAVLAMYRYQNPPKLVKE